MPAAPEALGTAAPPPRLRALLVSTVFPNAALPHHGLFVRRRLQSLPPWVEARVLAPAPWFPGTAGLRPGYRQPVAALEDQDGLAVHHPRFLSFPGVFKSLDGLLLLRALLPAARRLRRQFDFEIVDAHFAYPEGLAAVLLGRALRLPVVLTLRGTLPQLAHHRLRRAQAGHAVRRADRVIALSQSLRAEAASLGRPARDIRVIGNGVDADRFRPLDREDARRRLNLPEAGSYLISVGTLVRRKGVHLVLEALAALRQEGLDLRYLVVGGAGAEGWYGSDLRRQVARLRLEPYVTFAGAQPPSELAWWYSAADAFVLASELEGSSNALLEAIACGTPAVATATGDAAEVLAESDAGVLVAARAVAALRQGIVSALGRSWDRQRLHAWARGRSWAAVGEQVGEVFLAARAGAETASAGAARIRERPLARERP